MEPARNRRGTPATAMPAEHRLRNVTEREPPIKAQTPKARGIAPKANSLVPAVNVVVVNVVVVNDAGEILLIRRTDNDNWAVPGGAVDGSSDGGIHRTSLDVGHKSTHVTETMYRHVIVPTQRNDLGLP